MSTCARYFILSLLCLNLTDLQSAAFQPPSGAPAALAPSSHPGAREVCEVRAPAATSDEERDRVASRRDALSRALRAAGISSFAVGYARMANALDPLPSFLVSSEGDRGVKGMPSPTKKVGGLSSKIRSVSRIMDELQRDLMQERWDLVDQYPNQLRSYVPVFTAYTDSAFPTDIPTDKGLRVALRYEVGRFFASLERFKQAATRKSLDESYVAYSDMSLHFDRYLRVGGLYTFYDNNVSLETYYKGVSDTSLIYEDPKKDPALVRDLVVLIKGPEKGRTGIVIGIYPDGSNTCAVKLDRYQGIREIRIVPQEWAAKRLGEQDPDDVFLIPQSSA
ncbi:hypothetical protein ACHAWF_001694 [Thalassiosira exigua]